MVDFLASVSSVEFAEGCSPVLMLEAFSVDEVVAKEDRLENITRKSVIYLTAEQLGLKNGGILPIRFNVRVEAFD